MSGIEIALAAVSAASTVAQGIAANKTAKYQAAALRQNADLARQQAAAEEDKYRRQTAKLLGRQRALFANGGVSLEGSPLLTQEETAANAELEALTIRHSGDVQSAKLLNEAMLTRLQGRGALASGATGAGTSLLGKYDSFLKRKPSASDVMPRLYPYEEA